MPNMPDKPDTWLIVMAWLSQHAPMFYAAALSCWIAFLRVIYGGGGGDRPCSNPACVVRSRPGHSRCSSTSTYRRVWRQRWAPSSALSA